MEVCATLFVLVLMAGAECLDALRIVNGLFLTLSFSFSVLSLSGV